MGKPRMIILIRHAQSEGNKNRDIHQMIPDHRVKLTDEGKRQAEEAGNRLRSMLKTDDKIQFFTSPYRRTRETTEGILSSLTASDPEHGPSPFPRHTIKVFEEPRLREQDFGNFQPCSAEMERMWQERADYGHFFYRIPNGESAADAYDRVSGFNESLWRNFSEPDFPSVCVLVTHGLMTRVFLMKWYHWSVEYFEDLRNVNHCEFVIMRQDPDNGKYLLENQLRTWSELKRRAAAAAVKEDPSATPLATKPMTSPSIPVRKWGGCETGCNHHHADFPRRRKVSHLPDITLPPAATAHTSQIEKEHRATASLPSHEVTGPEPPAPSAHTPAEYIVVTPDTSDASKVAERARQPGSTASNGNTATTGKEDEHKSPSTSRTLFALPIRPSSSYGHFGRDAGGSLSGAATPAEGLSDMDSDGTPGTSSYFPGANKQRPTLSANPSGFEGTKNAAGAHGRGKISGAAVRKGLRKKPTAQDLEEWAKQSGMGSGARADPLGDEADDEEGGYLDEGGDEEMDGVNLELSEVENEETRDKSLRGSVY